MLARFGHCEAKFLGFEVGADRQELNRSLNIQLGDTSFTDEQVEAMARGVREAFRLSDVVGAVIDPEFATRRPELDVLLKGIARSAKSLGLWSDRQLGCSPRIHLDLIRDGGLRRIIDHAEDILLISCRNLVDPFSETFGKQVAQIFVPQERRTRHMMQETRSGPHFPDAFLAIRQEIQQLSRPGQLVLCGAGFLGKTYCVDARTRGAVVLDIGSAFDVLAGVHSRTSFDLPEYTDQAITHAAISEDPPRGVIRRFSPLPNKPKG